ncbi:MAG: ribosome recycling factor [Bacteroidota bacterium]|nr:ribosome recycling factor [Candidatus Kapabacteria bacterium]MCS7302670.1 ribosome recycling factor [Candidatus Kapabacteria bacterium]MDW8074928.1 ribosome recycling factor [Bacteroidota bacterium]MDW8271567.1 ribosome recycling factor [Bacteroidota bacterium]
MPIPAILNDTQQRMSKAVEHLQQQLARIRTGRASVAMLDGIKVNYYGTPTPLQQVGSISIPEPRMIVIQPWERSMLSEIEKAIKASDLGLNPTNDGAVIRIPIPPLTEERRKEIVKSCGKMAEEARIAVRQVRRDAMEQLKKAEKEEGFSEDDRRRAEEDVQRLTDRFIKEIDEIAKRKEQEIMNE